MLKVSDAFNDAFAASGRELRARVTIGKNVYDSDDLTSINYDSGAMTGEQFSIGSTYMNSAKITFSHLVEGLKQLDEVVVEFGIIKDDGSTEYVKMGTFIIDDKIQMDRNNNSTTIECMDRMVMLGGTYKSKLGYPADIQAVAVEIANMAGVKANSTSFSRLPKQQINEPVGYSYRDAIGLIAQFAMGFALFDRDGLLDIRTLADNEFKIAPSQYFLKGLVKNETFFKLNGISCTVVSTSTDENGNETSKTTVLQSGSTAGSQIKLANNVMTQDVLDRMYEALKFTNYYPFSLNWNGNPAIEAGDWITLEDMQGNEFKVPNMSYTLTYNGGLTASSKAETSTNSSVTYSYGGSISNIVNEIGGREGADGNHIYEGTEDQEPLFPKEGDLWYKHVGPDTEELIYTNGAWKFLTSTKTATDAQKAADEAKEEAEKATAGANDAVSKANDAVAQAGFANNTADQAKSDAATSLQKALDAYAHGDQIKTGLTADIDAVKGQVSLKANQVDVDKLGGRVTNAEAQIKLQADQIALTVSKTEITNILGDYATQTWTQSQVKITADGINSTLSSVQTQVQNSAVGTNLISGSYESSWNFSNNEGATIQKVTMDSGEVALHVIGTNGASGFYVFFNFPSGNYTASVEVKGTGIINRLGWENISQAGMTPTSNWQRVSRTSPFDGKAHAFILYGTMDVYVRFLKVEKGSLATDWCPNPADNATVSAVSKLSQTVNGIQGTVQNKADKSQVTQLAGQITSVVEITDSITNANRNYVANSNFLDNANEWSFNEDTGLSHDAQSEPWIFGKKKALHFYGTPTTNFKGAQQIIPMPVASKGSIIYLSMLATKDGSPVSPIRTGLHFLDASGAIIDQVWHDFKMSEIPENSVAPARLLWKVIAPSAASSVKLMIYGIPNQVVNFYVTDIKLEMNSHTPWTPALEDETTRSQITQLSNDINLRVEKGDVINQINISPEGILIAGQKIHITGQTSIDNAVIKDAMIANIKADKITAGTLNAANINVVNLDANNITTGTLRGANLSMNLNTGEILFQKGAIKSTNGKLNINVDDGTLSVTDSMNRGVLFQDGNLYLSTVSGGVFNPFVDKPKYGSVSYVDNFLNTYSGMAVTGSEGLLLLSGKEIVVGTITETYIKKGLGILLGKNSIYIGGENNTNGTYISGGKKFDGFLNDMTASISVGAGDLNEDIWIDSGKTIDLNYSPGAIMTSNPGGHLRLSSDGRSQYVLSVNTYNRTYGSGATMTITPNGVFGRISSASKYKLAINEINMIDDDAHRFLAVKPKQWFDKSETEALADIMSTGNTEYVDDVKSNPHTGFIAEDLYTAGLDDYVIRGNDGSLESIQYDRLPILHHQLIRELYSRLDAAEMEIYKLKQEVINNAS